jgi:hypothetical protein
MTVSLAAQRGRIHSICSEIAENRARLLIGITDRLVPEIQRGKRRQATLTFLSIDLIGDLMNLFRFDDGDDQGGDD